MFRKHIWRYGVVDVRDGNGLVRHGVIVDLVEDGGDLIVDFGYDGHHDERVPLTSCVAFQQEFPYGMHFGSRKPAIGQAVQVLHQRSSDQPWCWYPGRLLVQVDDHSLGEGYMHAHSLVKVVIDGEPSVEFVDTHRIQVATECSLTDKALRVARSSRFHDKFPRQNLHFRKYRLETKFYPGICQLAETPGFRDTWSKLTNTMFVRIEVLPDVQLITHYITSSKYKREIAEEDCLKVLRKMDFLFGYHQKRRQKRVREYDQEDSGEKQQKTKNNNPSEIFSQTKDSENDCLSTTALSHLPPELLTEILGYLCAERRTRCRRVCHGWDSIITCSPSVRIEFDGASPGMRIALAWALYKTFSTATNVRVLTVSHCARWIRYENIVPEVAAILNAMQVTVPVIVLTHMSAEYRDVRPEPPPRERQPVWSWRAVCRKLVLADVDLVMPEKCSREEVLTDLRGFRHLKGGLWLKTGSDWITREYYDHAEVGKSEILRLRRSVKNMTETRG
ncbi:uncharacterized protein LOC129595420 [Paramacrobiotus metropolitanus]|uniref:uncharacterized protein LOC129595420 n=1 Tax=Paramacrobiotus metropolitanus TaxID=2943436 RepID=UPI0024458E3D|nr:uncharacterized protein LOC129595420 [Paramacrobiotus metropolitanus]